MAWRSCGRDPGCSRAVSAAAHVIQGAHASSHLASLPIDVTNGHRAHILVRRIAGSPRTLTACPSATVQTLGMELTFKIDGAAATFRRTGITGRATLEADGERVTLQSPWNPATHISLGTTKTWERAVRGHRVQIRNERPLLMAGARANPVCRHRRRHAGRRRDRHLM